MIINRCEDLDRWCVAPTTIIADADNYYTKKQVDQLIVEASGMTSGIVQSMIDDSISGKADIDEVYTIEEINELLDDKADIEDIPMAVSELDNDLEFVSLEVVGNKLIFKTLNNNG